MLFDLALAVDAGRTLMLDREEMLAKARGAEIAIIGVEAMPETAAGEKKW